MVHDVMFVSAISPVHSGAGEGLGLIDRPIMRERTTNFPIIPGSTLKGVLRDEYEPKITKDMVESLFGPMDDGSKHAGCVSFSDASLFAFPVRSLKGSFVWATSPLILYRLWRIIEVAILTKRFRKLQALIAEPALHSKIGDVFINPEAESALVIANPANPSDNKVILEEFPLNMQTSDKLREFASKIGKFIFRSEKTFHEEFVKKLVILPDDRFNYFVSYATQVVPNIKIDDGTGTSSEGLRYSEYLPAETILYCLASFDKCLALDAATRQEFNEAEKVRKKIVDNKPNSGIIQIGADETTGKGIVKINFVSEVRNG